MSPDTGRVEVGDISAIRDGVHYMVLVPPGPTSSFRLSPLFNLPCGLVWVGGVTMAALYLQSCSLHELKRSVSNSLGSLRRLLMGPAAVDTASPSSPVCGNAAIPPETTDRQVTSNSQDGRGSDGVAPSANQETTTLPLGEGKHVTTIADVFEADTTEDGSDQDSSWAILSPPEPTTDAVATPALSLTERLSAIISRTAQRAAGDSSTIHPSTSGYEKREVWADEHDKRELEFHQAVTNPVFVGAEWRPEAGEAYRRVTRTNALASDESGEAVTSTYIQANHDPLSEETQS